MEFFENYYYLKVYFIHIERSLRFLLLLFSCQAVSYSSQPHGLQHTRLPCPSLSPWVCSNLHALNQWCHLTISSFVIPFSSCLQSFSALGSFPMSWLFASGGQSMLQHQSFQWIIQDWFPLLLTVLLSLLSKGVSRVFSNTTVWRHQFGTQPFLVSSSHICTWLLEIS